MRSERCLGPCVCRHLRFGSSCCVHLETLVVNCWPSSLIMMQVGFQPQQVFFHSGCPKEKGVLGMASLFEPAVQVPAGKQWIPLMVVHGPAHARANAYCCGQVWKSTGRHNQVGFRVRNGLLLTKVVTVTLGSGLPSMF